MSPSNGLDAIPSEPVREELWKLASALRYGSKMVKEHADNTAYNVTVITLALWALSDDLSTVAKDIVRLVTIDPSRNLNTRKVVSEVRRIRRISSKLAEVYKADTKMAGLPQPIKDIYWEIREASDSVYETISRSA